MLEADDWTVLGDLNSIAVFIWQSASEINRKTMAYRGIINNVNLTSLSDGRPINMNNTAVLDLLAAQQ